MKKLAISLLTIVFISFNYAYAQDLWTSFPSSTKSFMAAFVYNKGTVMISSKETTGYFGTEIELVQGKLTIGLKSGNIYTFDSKNFVSYNSGTAVYYLGKDKFGVDYKIYFSINTLGGKASAIHLVKIKPDDISAITYYVKEI